MYVCSRVYIKNYSRIFLEWIIAKRGWVQIRSLSSAIYFVFMFLSLVTQTCSISSFRGAGACPRLCLPSPGTSVGSEPSWACPAELWWLSGGLDQPPDVTLLFRKGKEHWEWRLSAGTRGVRVSCTGSSLPSGLQSSFSGTCVCVKGLSRLRADVWEYWQTALSCSGQAELTELRAAFTQGRKWERKALASHLLLVGGLQAGMAGDFCLPL